MGPAFFISSARFDRISLFIGPALTIYTWLLKLPFTLNPVQKFRFDIILNNIIEITVKTDKGQQNALWDQ